VPTTLMIIDSSLYPWQNKFGLALCC